MEQILTVEPQTDRKILSKFTKEEVYNATLDYFKGDTLAAEVWMNKYCLKDGDGNYYEMTPDDMHRRLAREFARIERKYPNPLTEETIFEKINKFKRIVPQGSPMSGIGNDFQVVSLSNCFVIGNEELADSYGGIMKLDQELVQLQKRRAGVGLDLSFIRPAGSQVKNSALTSTGISPFMERYSNSTKEVAQGGRRGALMETIHVKHPDSESFVDAKTVKGKVTGANISVKLDDDFMIAATQGTTYTQQYPIEGEATFVKEINASKLWKKIIHNAWKSAEPGILFWDTILRESIPDCYAHLGFKTVATNPCVSENTLILTDKGYCGIIDKLNKKTNVWNGKEFSEVTPIITGRNQKMFKITFSDGSELECTDYHKFYIWEGYQRDGNVLEKEAKDLNIGDKLEKYDFPVIKRGQGRTLNNINELFNQETIRKENPYYTLGFFAGDGTLHRNDPIIQLYGEKKKLIEHFNVDSNISENLDVDRISFKCKLPYIPNSIGYNKIKTYVPKINDVLPLTYEDTLSWLAGIIDSDGSRNSEEGSISISSIDRNFLMDIKLHVLNTLGINGHVIDEKEGGLKEIKGKSYNTNKSYRLIISAYNVKQLRDLGLKTFRVKIGDVNPNRDSSKFITVKSIERMDDAKHVFCFKEEKRGRGCFNGIITGQCGEITLCANDSCRLLAINLFGYVINPFQPDAYFDWDAFNEDIIIGERLMDDIVDLELEKIDKIIEKINNDPEPDYIKATELNLWLNIKKKAEQGRRTGLGVTGEGDMLAALDLRYGTDEANEFSEEVHRTLKLGAYRSSVEMAKERGMFPLFSAEFEANNPFIQRIKEEDYDLWLDMQKYGRRNMALLTIAPTGSVSILTQTTSGLECVFLVYYTRRKKINQNDGNIRVDFVDEQGDQWTEFPVLHHKFELWLDINGYDVQDIKENWTKEEIDTLVKKSPYYKATSADVDWVKKVEMQGMIQKHVDHSISVTMNLPKDVSEDVVASVYQKGWEVGCKGITVYREGSRDGVLISDDEKKIKEEKKLFHDNHAPKRPKRVTSDIIRFQNNHEKWVAVVGIIEGRPYEIFTGRLENGLSMLPNSVTTCEVVKHKLINWEGEKVSRYDIEYVDSNGEKQVHEGLNNTFNPEYWNYAKMISAVLRNGMPIIYVVELINSLNLDDSHLNTWKAGVGRVMKKYVSSGLAKGSCPNCGGKLAYSESCLRCVSCGAEKCGS